MYKMELGKMERYEKIVVRKFHHVVAVSESDRALMTKWVDGDRVTSFRPLWDLAGIPTCSRCAGTRAVVTFVGAWMDWEPNVDGVEYFAREIWPAIKADCARSAVADRGAKSRRA